METRVDKAARLSWLPGAQTRDDQSVLVQFALGVAAADADKVSQARLEYSDGVFIVALRKRLDAAIESNQDVARHELARSVEVRQFLQSMVQCLPIFAGCRSQCIVKVDKMTAGARKGLLPVIGQLAPMGLKA